MGTTIAGVVVLIIVIVVGASLMEGIQSNSGGSPGNVRADLSDGFSVLTSFVEQGGPAEVQTGTASLISNTFTGNQTISPTCSTTPINSYIQLINVGPTKASVKAVTIMYAGETNLFTISGSCSIGKAGSPTSTTYVLFKGPSKLPNSDAPEPGISYTGTVALADGSHLLVSGYFYEGSQNVSTVATTIPAADFSQGTPGNATCSVTPPATGAYVLLNNTGTVGATFTSVTINANGTANVFPTVGSCNIGPDGTADAQVYIIFGTSNKLEVVPKAGQPFSGQVAMARQAAPLSFSGKFQ